MRALFLFISMSLVMALLTGCAATRALQREAIHQSNTLSEIHQQQVLNNLAKFVCDPNALPDFAWPKEGTAQITDHCEGSGSLMWDAAGFMGAMLSSMFSRDKQDSWTLEPINDPRKLELMRCAYQRAVANCNSNNGPSSFCPDCDAQTKTFYGADHGSNAMFKSATYDCITPGCCNWFAFGPKCRVPKCCCHVGHYCDTYVWILPGGEDQLSKLTLTILDFAMNDPAQAPQKVVELQYNINSDGTRGNISSWQETFNADVDDPLKPATSAPDNARSASARRQANESEPLPAPSGVMYVPEFPVYRQQRTEVPSMGILQLRQQLNTVTPIR
jgi:hypothetical protein